MQEGIKNDNIISKSFFGSLTPFYAFMQSLQDKHNSPTTRNLGGFLIKSKQACRTTQNGKLIILNQKPRKVITSQETRQS